MIEKKNRQNVLLQVNFDKLSHSIKCHFDEKSIQQHVFQQNVVQSKNNFLRFVLNKLQCSFIV